METLFKKHVRKIDAVSIKFSRSLKKEIYWDDRLIGIKGQRGVGKTTLLLQHIKQTFGFSNKCLYASLDDIYFSANTIVDLAENFVMSGGTHLFLDEVHKYKNWSQEIKNIYDDFPGLQIVFTGSSLLEILNARADLSRRAMMYYLQGLSFREFLNFSLKTAFDIYTLDEIIKNQQKLSIEISNKIKPVEHFKKYLSNGYFPFFIDSAKNYFDRIEEIINMILEIELPVNKALSLASISKIKLLLYIISQATPFKPNVSKLSQRIGISRNTFLTYLFYLNEAKIINNLYSSVHGISKLQKPEKIFLENTNFIIALADTTPSIGNIRETFFLNQLSAKHKITYPKAGDFLVDGKYLFEIGGKDKSQKQILGIKNAYIAADDIEYGYKNKIPLWLFGFLY